MPSFIVATFQIYFILLKEMKYKTFKIWEKDRVMRYKVTILRNISYCEKAYDVNIYI